MALNVSSSQIYAGRYHYEKPVTANLLDKEKYPGTDSKQLAREVYVLDTVTFSDEGLARAKAYQVIYDHIEEDFADPDREPTWIKQADGTLVEETKQDRIDALNKAYSSRAEFAASAAKSMADIEETFHGANYGLGFKDELEKKVMESWQNAVSEKNLEKLRQKVASFKDYSLDFGIGADWSAAINALLYKNR